MGNRNLRAKGEGQRAKSRACERGGEGVCRRAHAYSLSHILTRSAALCFAILCLVFCVMCFMSSRVSAESASDIIGTVLEYAELKEEINLTGATLKELIGTDPKLSGLKQIALRTYWIPMPPDDAEMESINTRLVREGWRMLLRSVDEDRTVLIYEKEKEGVRENLRIVLVTRSEVSEMILLGTIRLSELDKLRNVILRSMPGFHKLQPIADFFKASPSPSQEASDAAIKSAIRRMQGSIAPRGKQTPLEVYYQLGLTYEQMGEYKKALEYYSSITKESDVPKLLLVRVYHGLAQCNERLGKHDEAIRYYKLLLEKLGSESDLAPSALALLRRLEAAEDESSIIKTLMKNAGNLTKLGEYEKAIEIYREIVNSALVRSDAAHAQLMIGMAYGRLNQREEEIEALKEAVSNYPSATSHTYLGLAYQNAGMCEEALKQYKMAISDHPDASEWQSIKAYRGAAECSETLGMTEEMKHYYRELVEKFGHIADPRIAAAEKKLVMIERGDSMPFLGLGFRHTGVVKGALIVTVFKNGPCSAAGIKPGDILLAIDAQPTPNPRAVIKIIGGKRIGDQVTLLIQRNGDEIEVPVTLTETPDELER